MICPYDGMDCEIDYVMGEDDFLLSDEEVLERYYKLCIFCSHMTDGYKARE